MVDSGSSVDTEQDRKLTAMTMDTGGGIRIPRFLANSWQQRETRGMTVNHQWKSSLLQAPEETAYRNISHPHRTYHVQNAYNSCGPLRAWRAWTMLEQDLQAVKSCTAMKHVA